MKYLAMIVYTSVHIQEGRNLHNDQWGFQILLYRIIISQIRFMETEITHLEIIIPHSHQLKPQIYLLVPSSRLVVNLIQRPNTWFLTPLWFLIEYLRNGTKLIITNHAIGKVIELTWIVFSISNKKQNQLSTTTQNLGQTTLVSRKV